MAGDELMRYAGGDMQGLGTPNMTSGNYLVCEFSHAGHAYLKQCPSS